MNVDTAQPLSPRTGSKPADVGTLLKKRAGISHIPSLEAGLRFDCIPVPGLYRHAIMAPSAGFASLWRPVSAQADFSHLQSTRFCNA